MSFADLASIFQHAAKHHPSLMEPYVIQAAGTDDRLEQERIMRRGMAETIRQRFPLAGDR